MVLPRRSSMLCSVVLVTAGMTGAWADPTVSTWVDAEGVRHFSQFPPAEPVEQLETIELDALPAAVPLDARLESLRAVSRDLELARQQREEERKRRADAAAKPGQAVQSSEPLPDRDVLFVPYLRPRLPGHPFLLRHPPHGHKGKPPLEPDKPASPSRGLAPHLGSGSP